MIFGLKQERLFEELQTQLRAREHEIHGLHRQIAAAQGALGEATRRAEIAQTNFDWARVRMNQLEAERAQLLSVLLKTPMGAIEIAREPDDIGHGVPNYPGISFDDLGDIEAQRMGLTHDDDGRVTN